MKDKNIIFLDIDGVFNCQLFYSEYFKSKIKFIDGIPLYKQAKKWLRKLVKAKEMTSQEYYASQLCSTRIGWFNELCEQTNSVVVISSTWRSSKTVEELQKIFNDNGATFQIISKTGYCCSRIRGVEIHNWLHENITPEAHGCHYFDFYKYAIIDDDSDMLLNQQDHFFQTDTYSGLTPSTCYKIKRFFLHKTF